MRPLNCFFFREGKTDDFFLPRLIERALARLCRNDAVEISAVISLPIEGPLVSGVCAEAVRAASEATLYFYHYDGSANLQQETQKYWDPLIAAWPPLSQPLVRVVPVREMEAWAVADVTAVAAVAGRRPAASDVFEHHFLATPERLTDPKKTLRALVSQGRRRRTPGPEMYLRELADTASLEVLDRLPSFIRWLSETSDALRKLRIIS